MGDWWKISDEDKRAILLLEVVGLLHDLGKLSDRFLKSQAKDRDYRYAYKLVSDPARVFLIEHELQGVKGETSNRERVRQLLNMKSVWHDPTVATELLSRFNQSRRTTERVDRIVEELGKIAAGMSSPDDAKIVLGGLKAAFEILGWLDVADAPSHDAPFRERSDLSDVLASFIIEGWDGQVYSLAELLSVTAVRHAEMTWSPWLGKAMEPAKLVSCLHGASHYEKEEPPNNKQEYQDMYRASPFGHEERIEVEKDKGLSAALKALPLERIGEVLTEKRRDWLEEMRLLLTRGQGDTRRPTNEVTLWDWGYTVASFVKAALPSILHRSGPTDLNMLRWRVLRVNIDLLGLYGKAHKVTDLLGSQAAVNGAFAEVKTLLEETYPIANELYRDATGIYFLFPDFDLPNELKEQILHCFDLDLRPIIELGSEAISAADLDAKKDTESAKLIARPRDAALKALERPIRTDNLYTWEAEWKDAKTEACTACGLRPVGYPHEGSEAEKALRLSEWADQEKAERRHVCRICLDRRGRRSQDWVAGGRKDTIWIDEVADLNGRFALVVARFDLDGWLDGRLVHTIVVADEEKELTKNPSPARLRRIWATTQTFWEAVPHLRDECDRPVFPPTGPRLEIRGSFVPDDPRRGLGAYHVYELNLGASTLSVVWKPPQQGRGGRFISIDNLAYTAKQQGWPVPAQLKDEDRDSYDRRQAQEAAERLMAQLDGARFFVIEEPAGYGGKNKRLGLVTEVRVSKLEDVYTPIIPILAEPSRFMALVPASRALDVAQAIKSKYECEMGKVRDRLPLHLGLIFAPRRTPLRAVLEAGQAMLTTVEEDWTKRGQMWEVLSVHKKALDDCQNVIEQVALVLAIPGQGADSKPDQQSRTVAWSVRTVMEDGKTRDSWYPHLLTEKPTKPQKPEEELKLSKVHIAKLKQGAKVWVRPSCFDFEFLDTSARRFDVSYDEHGRRRERPTRPYLLEDLERLDELWSLMQHLETTQINAVGGTIETARRDWEVGWGEEAERDRVFCRFVEDTLAEANWPREMRWCDIDQTERDNLVTAAVRGELTDVLELRMEILKQRPEREREEAIQ